MEDLGFDRLKPTSDEIERLREAVGQAGIAAGELEIAYDELESPFGDLLGARTDRGLVLLSYPKDSPERILERLASEVSPRILRLPRRLEPVRRQLGEYFEGGRRDFELEIDWRLTKGFVCEVLRRTHEIPFGRTVTYREIAARAGSPRAYRAAGSALGANPIPIVVPCHRVLRTGGALGGYGGGLDVKRRLLELEGALQTDPS